MHNLLQFWNVFESIANLTTDLSASGTLLIGDKSFWEDMRVEVVCASTLVAHHTKPYVSQYRIAGEDPSSRLVRGFLVTVDIRTA